MKKSLTLTFTLLIGLFSTTVLAEKTHAFTVTSATLTGPATIPKGGKATYTWTLAGTDAGKILGTSLLWSVYEQDGVFDDLLVDETRFVVTDDNTGKFTYTDTFELECTKDCYIKGKDGQDDEKSPGTIFVLFEHSLTGINAATSNTLRVDCVPEPLTILGTGVAIGFGTFFKKKQLKIK